MPTVAFGQDEQHASPPVPSPSSAVSMAEPLRAAAQRHAERVRRLRIHLAVWALGTAVTTGLWVQHEWQANGAFQRFAHEGNPGDWNPTLPAVIVGIWSLVVGIMALRVLLERPVTAADLDREIGRPTAGERTAEADLGEIVYRRLERVRRVRFHVAAWVFGMIVATPLNALIEWQDNGAFERFSGNSRPGSWDPWVLYVGGIWALVIVALALWLHLEEPRRRLRAGSHPHRLRPG